MERIMVQKQAIVLDEEYELSAFDHLACMNMRHICDCEEGAMPAA